MISLICLIVAAIIFLLVAGGVGSPRINLTALGLAFFAAAFIFTSHVIGSL